MSYSFSVVASSKDDAAEKIVAEFANVVASQPTHKADQAAAIAAGGAFVGLLAELHPGQEYTVSISGSLNQHAPGEYLGASISVSASIRASAKEKASG